MTSKRNNKNTTNHDNNNIENEDAVASKEFKLKFLDEAQTLSFVFELDKKTASYEKTKSNVKLQEQMRNIPVWQHADCSTADELNKVFELIVNEGKYVPYVSSAVDATTTPPYFDRQRMLDAQKTIEGISGLMGISTMMGMHLAMQLNEILLPLLKTGRSRTVPDLLARTLTAIKMTKTIYETPFFDQRDEVSNQMIEGWKSILLIRGMHERAFKTINEKTCKEAQFDNEQCLANNKPREKLWMNQYDCTLLQFGFVGLICIDPKRFGLHFKTREQYAKVMCDICYYWRVYNYCLGIEDRFNIFQFCNSFDKQRTFLLAMFNHVKFKLNDERKVPLAPDAATGIFLAFADLMVALNVNIIEHWWHKTGISFTGAPLKRLSPLDCIKMSAFCTLTQCVLKYDRMHPIIKRRMDAKMEAFMKNQELTKKKLTKKHADTVFELEPGFKFRQ